MNSHAITATEHGKMIETGSHSELIARRGLYIS